MWRFSRALVAPPASTRVVRRPEAQPIGAGHFDPAPFDPQLLETPHRDPQYLDPRQLDPYHLPRGAMLGALEQLLGHGGEAHQTLAVLAIRLSVGGIAEFDFDPKLEAVLADVARARLHAALRPGDQFGALAHDEWIAFLPMLSGAEQAELAAMKIARAFEPPLVYGSTQHAIHVAVGVACASAQAMPAHSLVRIARTAAHQASHRQDPYVVYDAQRGADEDAEQALESGLRLALSENALELHYQPQLLFATGEATASEALARWTTASGERISPGVFIPLAERRGLMPKFTNWSLNAGLRQLSAFRASGHALAISVNVSPLNLNEPDFPDFVAQCLEMWSVPADQVTLELTESAPMHGKTYLPMLKRLKAIGVDLAIDDFGTGYSSLALLPDLPVDELKIDQQFVRTMLTVEANMQIVRTVLALARNFGLRTVAEGIEDQATYDALGELGCTLAQGYFVGRPMPATAMSTWLTERAAGRR